MNRVWRNLEDGRGVLLFITTVGADAIGIEPPAGADEAEQPVAASAKDAGAVPYAINEGTNSAGEPTAGIPADAPAGADTALVEAPAKRRGRPRKAAPRGADAAPARKTRGDTKQAQLIAMLRRKEGATIAQIVAATEWAPHTVRGFFAGALKKMGWMPLSPTASQCAKLVVLNSQGTGEGIHGESYHHRRGSGKERVPAAWCSC
jgi:hypothetical protein